MICQNDPTRNSSSLWNTKGFKSRRDGFLVDQSEARGPLVKMLKSVFWVHIQVVVLPAASVLKWVRFGGREVAEEAEEEVEVVAS